MVPTILNTPYLGHSVNQSIVQQFTRDGNMRQRDLKASPTGLIQMTICSRSCTRLMKWLKIPSLQMKSQHAEKIRNRYSSTIVQCPRRAHFNPISKLNFSFPVSSLNINFSLLIWTFLTSSFEILLYATNMDVCTRHEYDIYSKCMRVFCNVRTMYYMFIMIKATIHLILNMHEVHPSPCGPSGSLSLWRKTCSHHLSGM